jgi:hypothetical protein
MLHYPPYLRKITLKFFNNFIYMLVSAVTNLFFYEDIKTLCLSL